MNNLDKFMLDFVPKNYEINEFFTKTTLKWWDRVDLFTKFIYAVNPIITPQEVLKEYDRSLAKIINIKGINSFVVEHIKSFQNRMILAQTLKTIGLTLLDLRRQQAKKRKITTEITREDFQTAVENDRINNKAEIFSDDYTQEPDEAVDEIFRYPCSNINNSPSRATPPLQHYSHLQSQQPQISSPSDPFISPGIEPETDVSENEDGSEKSDFDTSDHEETVDEMVSNDNKKNGPLREEHREMIEKVYNNMKKERMWRLSTGKYVEEELFKLGKKLKFEQLVFIFFVSLLQLCYKMIY
ncbi:hypothetical protein RclHR1_07230003 [Rhizophagus clarus]|uniref:Uncharacterized protein n=1 Tax=Rhizophagus clarus TaxID=94130 RepID=A0A2Z6RVR5_9GLOM|nr:hypothetical protein RclHR1_07230003 [Rhizophagus clarus]